MRNFIFATALLLAAGTAFAQTEDRVAPRPSTTPTRIEGLETGKRFFELKDAVVTDGDTTTTKYTWTVSQYSGWNSADSQYPLSAVDSSFLTKDADGKDVLTDAGQEIYNTRKNNARQNGGWYNLSSTLVRYDKEAFSYTVFDVDNTSREWELSVILDDEGNVDMDQSKNLVNYRDVYDYYVEKDSNGNASLKQGEFLRRVYYFTVPVGAVEEIATIRKDELGNTIYDENGNPIIDKELKYPVSELGIKVDTAVSTVNPTEPSLFYVVDSQQNNGKNYYLAYGNTDNAADRKDPEIAFGQPLPSPIATLLIALGFGAAVMLYRNRKQVKA